MYPSISLNSFVFHPYFEKKKKKGFSPPRDTLGGSEALASLSFMSHTFVALLRAELAAQPRPYFYSVRPILARFTSSTACSLSGTYTAFGFERCIQLPACWNECPVTCDTNGCLLELLFPAVVLGLAFRVLLVALAAVHVRAWREFFCAVRRCGKHGRSGTGVAVKEA